MLSKRFVNDLIGFNWLYCWSHYYGLVKPPETYISCPYTTKELGFVFRFAVGLPKREVPK